MTLLTVAGAANRAASLTAYDLNEGIIKWKIPLGEVPELAAKGIKNTGTHYPKVGPVVTAGGLIFTGTRDRKVRALDAATGAVLWEKELDAALEGIPAIYEMGGRQYIVFCAAAQAGLTPATQGRIPGAYVASLCRGGEYSVVKERAAQSAGKMVTELGLKSLREGGLDCR